MNRDTETVYKVCLAKEVLDDGGSVILLGQYIVCCLVLILVDM